MSKVTKGAGCALVGIGYGAMGILGLAIHVWTIVVAFATTGLIGAIITLVLPVFAQIYWFIKVWSVTGTILNLYCMAVLAYIGCWLVVIVGVMLSDS